MCFSIHNSGMVGWLRMQVRVIEAWREDIATQPELDLEMITRLERHYQWLTAEVSILESQQARAQTAASRSLTNVAYASRSVG